MLGLASALIIRGFLVFRNWFTLFYPWIVKFIVCFSFFMWLLSVGDSSWHFHKLACILLPTCGFLVLCTISEQTQITCLSMTGVCILVKTSICHWHTVIVLVSQALRKPALVSRFFIVLRSTGKCGKFGKRIMILIIYIIYWYNYLILFTQN